MSKTIAKWYWVKYGFRIKIMIFVPNKKMTLNHFWTCATHDTPTKYHNINVLNDMQANKHHLNCYCSFPEMIGFVSKSCDRCIGFHEILHVLN